MLQKILHHKHLLVQCTLILILSGLWGCAHGNKGGVTPKDSVVDPSLVAEDTQNPETASQAPDNDPFFEDNSSDPFFDDNTGGPADLTPETLVADPIAPFNRAMFTFNDRAYFWFLKPIAQGYRAVTPQFFRKGVRNAFKNITMPIRFVSSLLQGKIKGAGTELSRFVINTTVGVGGVWDPADRYAGLKPYDEDLGQTLGSYGIGNGFYIVWPFLGPSTVRDSVGMAGEIFLNPLYYVEPTELAYGLGALELVNATSLRIGDYETVKSASMDPYVMIRDFYIQLRKKKIAE